MSNFARGMAEKPSKVENSSSEFLGWSYLERGMLGANPSSGGELYVFCFPPLPAEPKERNFMKNLGAVFTKANLGNALIFILSMVAAGIVYNWYITAFNVR